MRWDFQELYGRTALDIDDVRQSLEVLGTDGRGWSSAICGGPVGARYEKALEVICGGPVRMLGALETSSMGVNLELRDMRDATLILGIRETL